MPRSLRLLCGSLLGLLLGCGSVSHTPVTTLPSAKHGIVRGGQQPIAGASVQLYAVGTTGDGSAATPLLNPAAITAGSPSVVPTDTVTALLILANHPSLNTIALFDLAAANARPLAHFDND